MKKILSAAVAAVALTASAEVAVKDGETIAFMGDTLTYFGQRSPVGYVHLAMKGLEVAGVKDAKLLTLGVWGQRSDNMFKRLDRDVIARQDGTRVSCLVLFTGPDEIWLSKPTKDWTIENWKTDVSAIFDKCVAANVKVVVVTIPVFEKGKKYDELPENVKAAPLNEYLRAEAKRRKLLIADLNAQMRAGYAADPKVRYMGDRGVALNDAGQKLTGWCVLEALGVPSTRKGELATVWEDMPGRFGVTGYLNKRERDELNRRIKESGLSEAEYVREQLGL